MSTYSALDETVKVPCPRCGSADARQWRGRYACPGCGLLWVPYMEPPLSAAERYRARRTLDERSEADPPHGGYWVRRANEQEGES